jgi:hypothetical protein
MSKVIVCVDASAMTVVPVELNRVVADPADFLELRVGHIDKASLSAVALAKRAGTIPTQIRLCVLTYVTILPCDAHDAARFDMIDLSRNVHKKTTSSASGAILCIPRS